MRSARLFRVGAIAIVSPLWSCLEPNPYAQPCYFHCWEFPVAIADGDSDGRFDELCVNHWSNASMQVPLPPNGSLLARACLSTQSDHEAIASAVSLLEAGAESELSAAQRQSWTDLVTRLADDVSAQCIQHVAGSPGYQDIDPGLGGSQACTEVSAPGVCSPLGTQVSQALALDEGPPPVLPSYAGIEYGSAGTRPCDFEPDFSDTGQIVDPEPSSSDSAADSTGSFGDVGSGVSCHSLRCNVLESVAARVIAHFQQFISDGVSLQILDSGRPCNVRGARLGGLDAGEESAELLRALDLRNGDIVTHVQGVALIDGRSTAHAMEAIRASSGVITATVRRRQSSSSCTTLPYTIEIVP